MIQLLSLVWQDQDIPGCEMKQAPAEVIAVAAEEQANAFIIVEKVGIEGEKLQQAPISQISAAAEQG